ncbi:hypothetical protein LLG46_00070 [bacterium]|nr:hypothetical protein [bacterium]
MAKWQHNQAKCDEMTGKFQLNVVHWLWTSNACLVLSDDVWLSKNLRFVGEGYAVILCFTV